MLAILCFAVTLSSVRAEVTDADVFVLDSSSRVLYELNAISSAFGPSLPSNGISGHIASASPADACSPIKPAPHHHVNQTPWFALVHRNQCSFVEKVTNVQNAGFEAAIVHNIDSDNLVQMHGQTSSVTIPSVFIGATSANVLRQYNYSLSHLIVMQLSDGNYRFLWPFVGVLTICMFIMVMFTIVRFIAGKIHKYMTCVSKSNLKKLPVKKFKKGDDYDMCAICLEEYETGDKLRILPCSHAFHQKCIDPWLTKTKQTCPLCKKRCFPHPLGDDSDDDFATAEANRVAASERTPLLTARETNEGQANNYGGSQLSMSASVESSLLDLDLDEPVVNDLSAGHWQQSSVEVHHAGLSDSDEEEDGDISQNHQAAKLFGMLTPGAGSAFVGNSESSAADAVLLDLGKEHDLMRLEDHLERGEEPTSEVVEPWAVFEEDDDILPLSDSGKPSSEVEVHSDSQLIDWCHASNAGYCNAPVV